MKKITYYILLSLFFLALSVSSCNDEDFLEEKATTAYTTENSYNTASQVDASITNMYVHIRYWFQVNNFMKGLGTDMWDIPYWRSSGNGLSNYSSWSSEKSEIEANWNAFYQLVSFANQTLEGADSEKIVWTDQAEYNYAIAQSKFFRGFAFLTLGELYGGVPIVTEFYTVPKYDFVRSSRAETYQQAITDLEDALDGLPQYPEEAGRIGKGAAFHYLAEAYLALAIDQDNNSTYLDQAISYANDAIALHPLMTERFGARATEGQGAAMNGVTAYYADGDVFFDLFQRGNLDYAEGNTEALWTLENDYSIYLQYGGDNRLEYPRNFSPVLRNVNWNAAHKENNSSPWPGKIDAYVGGRAVANYSPTDYAQTTVWEGSYGDDMRNNSLNMRREFVCQDTSSTYYGQVVTEDMLDPNTLENFYPICTKLAPIDDWGYEDLADGGNRSNMFRDEYACRSAETYLLRAEAYYRKGDLSNAAADINVLRSRAQCAYTVQSGDVDLDLILDERARELYGEERRWCTLLRMGGTVVTDRINKYSYFAGAENTYYQGSGSQAKGWNLFPIPQNVIDSNIEATLEQNDGWD